MAFAFSSSSSLCLSGPLVKQSLGFSHRDCKSILAMGYFVGKGDDGALSSGSLDLVSGGFCSLLVLISVPLWAFDQAKT